MPEDNVFEGKKILVAGGTGMIGIPLVKMLIGRGASVWSASLDLDASRKVEKSVRIYVDLTSINSCLGVCKGMDIVCNLLCTKGSPATNKTNPASFLVPMLMYNTNLMEAARRCEVKSYLFTSSVCVYPPQEIFFEDDPFERPPSENDKWAGSAKRIGEMQAQAYAIEYGWNEISVVRPSNVYGPFDNFDPFNAMVIPSLIRRVAEAEDKIIVWGDGTAERDFIYAEDVADGMILVLENKLPPTRPINLGSGHGVSIKRLVETLVSISGKKLKIIWDTSKPSGDRKRIFDTTWSKKIGFSPKTSLEEGLAKTYNWYIEKGSEDTDRYDIFKDSKFYPIK